MQCSLLGRVSALVLKVNKQLRLWTVFVSSMRSPANVTEDL
jgi:hypothetical protein